MLEELPHLGEGIVIDQDHAIEVLQKLVIEMDSRYLRFRKWKVSNLMPYNAEISLGQKGAENLLGKGHLIARLSGESDLIYAQVPFISDEEAAELVEIINRRHRSD